MKKSFIFSILMFSAMMASTSAVCAQGRGRTGPDPAVYRDVDLEKDSMSNLEAARLYFKLRKAYVGSLKRTEEIIAANPNFAKIEEALFIAGESSLFLSENKGKQKPSLYFVFDGDTKKTLTSEEFKDLARDYLTRLVTEFPDSSFRKQAELDLQTLGPKTAVSSKQ